MAKYQKYAEYKDSGVEWLGEIPSHWECKPLKYILIEPMKNGIFKKKDQFGRGSLLINVSDLYVSDNFILDDGLDCVETTQEEQKTYRVNNGDLFFVRSSLKLEGIGRSACYVGSSNDVVFECHIVNAKPKNSEISSKFLTRYLNSHNVINEYVRRSKTTTMTTIDQNSLSTMIVPIPPIEEQRKLDDFLDYELAIIQSLIAKQEQLIALLQEKRQAVISHAVTKGLNPDVKMKDSGVEWLGQVPEHWNMAPIRRSLLEHRQGYYTTDSYVDKGLKLLRITDLRDLGEIDISNCPMVSESTTTHLFKLNKGDVIFARTGGAGTFGVITEDYENLIYASYLIRFRFMNEIFEPDYLRFLFQSDSFQLSVKQNIHGGVNQNIHAEDIKNTIVCIPSLSEQKKIVQYLTKQSLLFKNLLDRASESVKLMQERRTALISAAVTGKIDVRAWQADEPQSDVA